MSHGSASGTGNFVREVRGQIRAWSPGLEIYLRPLTMLGVADPMGSATFFIFGLFHFRHMHF